MMLNKRTIQKKISLEIQKKSISNEQHANLKVLTS